jgi:hypothetical protein
MRRCIARKDDKSKPGGTLQQMSKTSNQLSEMIFNSLKYNKAFPKNQPAYIGSRSLQVIVGGA